MTLAEPRVHPAVAAPALQQGAPAGVVSRCCAAAVDLGVLIVACLGGYLALSGVLFLWHPASFHFPRFDRSDVVAYAAVVFFGYLCAAWALTGRTLGNTMLGLRVLRSDHRHLGPVRAALRAVLYLVFPIGLLVCAAGGRRLSLQDIVLRTTVVYDWDELGPTRPTMARPTGV